MVKRNVSGNGGVEVLDIPGKREEVRIPAPKLGTGMFKIIGTAPYVQNKFSAKALQQIKDKQEAGSQAGKGKKRDPKDFQACYEGAIHRSVEGWIGIPASAFRSAMISACRLVGFKMTLAKLSIWILADGSDATDGTPLVKINGAPEYFEAPVRNDSGVVDVRARPLWREWSATVRIQWDGDQFSTADVSNLLYRAGLQVGIGEGRNDSRDSVGLGFGVFKVES